MRWLMVTPVFTVWQPAVFESGHSTLLSLNLVDYYSYGNNLLSKEHDMPTGPFDPLPGEDKEDTVPVQSDEDDN